MRRRTPTSIPTPRRSKAIWAATRRSDTQVEAIKSTAVVEAVVNQMHLDQDPEFTPKKPNPKLTPAMQHDALLDRVLKDLKVKRVGQTLLLDVSYTSESPTKAAMIANAFSQAFIQHQIIQKIQSANADNALLNSQIDEMRQKLEAADGGG